jgi:type IV pilus assembly protein PilE
MFFAASDSLAADQAFGRGTLFWRKQSMKMTGNKPYRHQQTGLTLIELLVALAIVAILSSIAYPVYSNYVTKARRAEGKAALMEIMQAQQRNYTANSTYTTDLSTIGYDTAANVSSESGHYLLSAGSCDGTAITSCVRLTAAPQVADAECGNLIYDSTGAKSISDGTGSADECW